MEDPMLPVELAHEEPVIDQLYVYCLALYM